MKRYLYAFGVVDEACENDDTKHQEEHQQSQFLGGRPEGLYEDLQAGAVSGEFEQSHYPDDREELEDVGVF